MANLPNWLIVGVMIWLCITTLGTLLQTERTKDQVIITNRLLTILIDETLERTNSNLDSLIDRDYGLKSINIKLNDQTIELGGIHNSLYKLQKISRTLDEIGSLSEKAEPS